MVVIGELLEDILVRNRPARLGVFQAGVDLLSDEDQVQDLIPHSLY